MVLCDYQFGGIVGDGGGRVVRECWEAGDQELEAVKGNGGLKRN